MEQPENSSKDETIEQLRLIQQMLVTKLETETNKMRVAATEDKHFPVKAVVRTVERQLIVTERALVQEIKMCVSEACRTECLDGLIMMVCEDVNELLQNTAEGEAERMASHVVVANSSVLRLDYYLYKYTFSSKGLRDKFKGGFYLKNAHFCTNCTKPRFKQNPDKLYITGKLVACRLQICMFYGTITNCNLTLVSQVYHMLCMTYRYLRKDF